MSCLDGFHACVLSTVLVAAVSVESVLDADFVMLVAAVLLW